MIKKYDFVGLTPIDFVNSITALFVDWYIGKILLDSPVIDPTLITADMLSTLFSMYLRPSIVPRTTAFYKKKKKNYTKYLIHHEGCDALNEYFKKQGNVN